VTTGLRILQISPQDIAGGAERVALNLHHGFLRYGVDARLLVRYRRTETLGVEEVHVYDGTYLWGLRLIDQWLSSRPHFRGRDTLRNMLSKIAMPQRLLDSWCGFDDYNYPYSYRLLQRTDWQPDIIQLHNLHGGYFDLRALPTLSNTIPVVWMLHDTWAFTGHCAYFIDCDRWQFGCGMCPDLRRPPVIRHDRTHDNWTLKRQIYAQSQLHVICPSQWLMSQVKKSILQPVTGRVIPNGIDLTIFKPGDKQAARLELGLPQNDYICLFVGVSGALTNPYKDYTTIAQAIDILLDAGLSYQLRFVCLGGRTHTNEDLKGAKLFVGRVTDPRRVALYYQAADVYLHAAKADNFPLAIIEASACGIPVVATAVGGISELVEDGVTGYLVPRGDAAAMAERVRILLEDSELRYVMSQRAAERAARLYDLERQVNDCLNLYAEIVARYKAAKDSR